MTMPCDQGNVYPESVVCGVGAVDVVRRADPTDVLLVRFVFTSFARRSAPSTLSCPVPCSRLLNPTSGWAVYIRIILTIFGVSLEFACSIIAIAPVTTGVETELPLRYIIRLFSDDVTCASSEGLFITR